MLTFRSCTVAFVILAVAGGIAVVQGILPAAVLWVLAAGFVAALAYGSIRIGSQFYLPALCRASGNARQIAITFDDGPDPVGTPALRAVLNEFGVKAAFFMVGRNVESYTGIVRDIDADGHCVGNHTFHHAPLFPLGGVEQTVTELERTARAIGAAIHKRPKLFRPPYGVTTPVLRRAVDLLGYTAVGWSIRSFDTVIRDRHRLLDRITQRLHPGAVILLHDTTPGIDEIVRSLLQYARAHGYDVVRLDALFGVEPYDKG